MEHTVRQAVLELDLPGESVAAMDSFRRFFENQVQPELAVLLDKAVRPGRESFVNRLEIDLGTIDPESARDDWRVRLRRAVSDALPPLPPERSGAEHSPALSSAEVSRPVTSGYLESILHYLRTGTLPWHERRNFREVEKAFRSSRSSSGLIDLQRAAGVSEILGEKESRTRFKRTLHPATRARIVAQYVEARLSASRVFFSSQSALQEFARKLAMRVIGKRLEPRYLAVLASPAFWNDVKLRLAGPDAIALLEDPTLLLKPWKLAEAREEAVPPQAAQGRPAEGEDGVLYVENAGIVLMAAYLPVFFSNIGLLGADRRFRDESARETAVHLAHFLATGDYQAHESQLALPKILCGIKVGSALGHEAALEESARLEALALLKSAIENWSAIGKTSVEGLRQTFLQREGRLEPRENGWCLTVEQRGVDVLLSSLPWTFRSIRLPWLDFTLQVDWA